ncbi:MAG: ABC transporter permease [Proteobacteria bacterium]|nr:ABC transporter permease [Pseudomonadota bacterium]
MGRYLLNRLILMIFSVWVVTTLTFVLMHSIPGGPFTKEKKLPPAVIKALNKKFHLDDPLLKQYTNYMKGVITFDFGPSFKQRGQTVNDFISKGLPVSARIGFLSILVSLFFGIPIGLISALKHSKWQDYAVLILATVGICIPNFVIATVFIYFFGLKLKLLPIYGLNSWDAYILPVIALSFYSLSFVARLVRSSMLEILEQDYIRTARAKGLSEGVVILKHGLRNGIIPVVSYLGPLFTFILCGSFIIEKIFSIPGLGKYYIESISNRDYTTIIGITVFDTILLVTAVLVVDLIYGLIDPRIKIYK